MKKIFWFATGIAAGLAVAKQLRENPEAQAALEDATKRARALGDAFTTGYKEREAELKKPAVKKPAAKKPATKKPATKKPATKTPAAKKPAVKKTATKPSAN
jgi:hypothetical protein